MYSQFSLPHLYYNWKKDNSNDGKSDSNQSSKQKIKKILVSDNTKCQVLKMLLKAKS